MTYPADISFVDDSKPTGDSVEVGAVGGPPVTEAKDKKSRFPPPILDPPEAQIEAFRIWIDQWLMFLEADQQKKQDEWAGQEEAYRAKPGAQTRMPFVGHSTTTVPAISMAVDPIHARLDTGIFKQTPVFAFKALKKDFVRFAPALEAWFDYYQKYKLKLRSVASPRILEEVKLGTCVFKTVYDRQAAKIKTYDTSDGSWQIVDKEEVRFSGPRVFGISLGDFLFPSLYQYLQDCPIVAERQRTTFGKLKVAEASGKLTDVDKLKGQEHVTRTKLEDSRESASSHQSTSHYVDEIEVFEVWCDYDINEDGLPEHLVATYHRDTRTLLQLRFNWYFHQRKPYTVIPYQVTNDSLYGIGVGEMAKPFQDALSKWERMAEDNTYIANIRMFIVKTGSGIEEVPRLYAGRCFFVDDPKSDFIPFQAGEVYQSTLSERQNLFGLLEKRTGVSDYLTGRESPIIGSRATATSTLALIQEGTKRVEEVLENNRQGFAEIAENCIYIWIQYGLEGLDDVVFGNDQIGSLVREFFDSISVENINGALAIDLSATDAAGNRQAMQAMQLQIIQVMMNYLQQLLAAGQAALQAQAMMPQFTQMVAEVMKAARAMFLDLLGKYDIRNPDDYLPDLEKFLLGPGPAGPGGQGPAGGPPGLPGGIAGLPGLQAGAAAPVGPIVPRPATPGSGNGGGIALPFAGINQGV